MNTENISRYAWKGRNDKTWYFDCRQTIVDIFGESEVKLVSNLLAATSIHTSLKANIQLFRKAYYEIQENKPFSNYLPNITDQLNKVRAGGELSGRKIRSFSHAMQGDKNAVVVDLWFMRAFQMRTKSPTPKQYDIIEAWTRLEATYRGYTAVEFGAMIWGGVRREMNGDNQTRYCDFLKYHLNNLFKVI